MKRLLLLLFLPLSVLAQVPADWIGQGRNKAADQTSSSAPTELATRFDDIVDLHDELLNDERVKNIGPRYALNRFDVALGVNVAGDIGIMSLGHSSAVELIWEREEKAQEREINIEARDAAEVQRKVKDHVLGFLNKFHMSKRKKKRIVRRIEQRTFESNKLINAMRTLPQVGAWQADGFYQDFFFSAKGDLLESASVGFSTKLRFRYKIVGTPLAPVGAGEMDRMQKTVYRFMRSLDAATRTAHGSKNFELKAVSISSSLELGLDLVLFSAAVGKGYVLEFKRHPNVVAFYSPEQAVTDVRRTLLSEQKLIKGVDIAEKIADSIDYERPQKSDMTLSRIKTKFSFDAGVGIFLVTLEKTSVLEFQYYRKKP